MPWPTNLPPRIPINHMGSVSSSGTQTTGGANTEISFATTPLNSLEVTAHDVDLHIKINAETNTHLVQSGGSIAFDNIHITKLTIVESGAQYSYSGLYYVDLS